MQGIAAVAAHSTRKSDDIHGSGGLKGARIGGASKTSYNVCFSSPENTFPSVYSEGGKPANPGDCSAKFRH